MPITTKCSSCDWTGKFKDAYAGMRGKCPSCGEPIQVPLEEPEEVETDFEVVDDDPPIKPLKSKKKDDDDERPSKSRRDGESERDRPSRSRRDEEEEDERPSKSRRRDEEKRSLTSRRDDDERSDRSRPSKKIKKKKAKEPQPLTGTAAMFAGVGMILGAIVWFILGLVYQDKIYFYPPILFVIGIGTFIRGMQEEEEKYK